MYVLCLSKVNVGAYYCVQLSVVSCAHVGIWNKGKRYKH